MDSLPSENLSSPNISLIKRKGSPSFTDEKDELHLSTQTPVKTPTSSAPRKASSRGTAFSVHERKEFTSLSSDPNILVQEDIGTRSAKKRMTECAHDKYEELVNLFDALYIALRLLILKNSQSTFSHISKSMEAFIQRPITYTHLAQMKYLMPDYIEITRTTVLNERTNRIKPDILVGLNPNSMEIKTIFRSKVADFAKSREKDDVPEAMLPHPFCKNQVSPIPNSPLLKNERNSLKDILPASHFPPSRSHKIYSINLEKSEVDCIKHRVVEDDSNSTLCTPVKEVPVPDSPCSSTPALPSRKLVKSVSRSLFPELSGEESDPNYLEKLSALTAEEECTINKAEVKRLKMIGHLPKLLIRIHYLYLLLNKTVLSKEELIHKLIFNDLGFIERADLEEELNLMMELVPEYVSEKKLLCGDRLICVDNTTSIACTREQLQLLMHKV